VHRGRPQCHRGTTFTSHVGLANGSQAAGMRTGAIRAEKNELGGHFHGRPKYESTTTSRSRMSPPPLCETRTIPQRSESCVQQVGTLTSLPTPSLGPYPRSRGNASEQRLLLAHCHVPLPPHTPLDEFLIVHLYLAGFPHTPFVLTHLHVSQPLPLHLSCIQYSMNLTFIFWREKKIQGGKLPKKAKGRCSA